MESNIKIKKHYQNKYTQFDNNFINNQILSFKAKGIFLYLWSKPDEWKVIVEDIAKHGKEGISAIYSALKELEEQGFLIRKRFYLNGKVAGMNYHLSDSAEFLNLENLNLENLNEENQNEYIYTNKDLSNKELKEKINKKENSVIKESLTTQKSISSEIEDEFDNLYALYKIKNQNEVVNLESTIDKIKSKTVKGKLYNSILNKYTISRKNYNYKDVYDGMFFYIVYLIAVRENGFDRREMDIERFFNKERWVDDWKGQAEIEIKKLGSKWQSDKIKSKSFEEIEQDIFNF